MAEPPRTGRVLHHWARSVEDLTRLNVEAMREMDALEAKRDRLTDRVAHAVTRFCGNVAFPAAHAVGVLGWILWNVFGPEQWRFDPFPFSLLGSWSSTEALILTCFVLIAQNSQMRVNERRNQLDLQINLLAEQENSKMLQLLQDIAKQVGALKEDDPEVGVLVQATVPDVLVRQIEEAYEEKEELERDEKHGNGKASPPTA
jgi:uncharacterized membrane protein